MDFKSTEVKKLIELAYFLHEKDMEVYWKYDNNPKCPEVELVPKVEDGIMGHPIKKLETGTVEGYYQKNYGHSSAIPTLILDVVKGEYIENGFIYDKALRFELDGSLNNESIEERELCILMLKPNLTGCAEADFPIIRGKKKKGFFDYNENIPELEIDGVYDDFLDVNVFDNMKDEEKLQIFLEIMETLGFKKEDVLELLRGVKTADEIFESVAPPDIAKKRVLYYNQRKYTFDGNTLVEVKPMDIDVTADIGISLDELPFPFFGPAIIDASLVNTYGIDFGENARGHKLININSNPKSINFAKLKNAIIDEVIDLTKVEAYKTEFGHHVIANIDNAIGNLRYTELLYAESPEGRIFCTDEYGILKVDDDGNLKKENLEKTPSVKKNIEVLVDASSGKTVEEGFLNGAEGIGLVRTEDMLIINGTPLYKPIFITTDEDERNKIIEECARVEREKLQSILKISNGKRVVIRLLDAKLGDILTKEQIYSHFYSNQELRGDAALMKYPKFLEMQARVILEASKKYDNPVDIIVPMNYNIRSISSVREIFQKVAEEINYNNFRIGAMVEYVWFLNRINYVAHYADFISIGLNDLTEDVMGLSRNSHHQCFAILDDIIKKALKNGIYKLKLLNPNISIGFCGMHTNFIENLDFFQDIGADSITCIPTFIPTAKRLLGNDEIKKEQQIRLCRVLNRIKDSKLNN